ncbi:MAG: endonuclease/exonuclease/phosphatase family protein [Burkholderiaceae bacterium]|nr:endonuclease/exonuclease/phosphatase family protein [Burkholderiaceae bacterium]
MPQEHAQPVLRVATYNIHKGVQGLGPARRLEIHNLALAVDTLDADIVCLQEVRRLNRREARYFTHWPDLPQADFLAPEGYEAVYATNAVTRQGEHGNALLSRWPVIAHNHIDISDHRFEQRGILHVQLLVHARPMHVIVVHFGLIPASRRRQTEQLRRYIAREIPPNQQLVVAGDFNEWGAATHRILSTDALRCAAHKALTYPSRLPIAQLDRIYARGLQPVSLMAPRGKIWSRMSDHLPLIAEFKL